MQNRDAYKWIQRWVGLSISIIVLTLPLNSEAYPIFAQQNYENPREATGRIVCANCHLAKKAVDIEVPQAVLPNTCLAQGKLIMILKLEKKNLAFKRTMNRDKSVFPQKNAMLAFFLKIFRQLCVLQFCSRGSLLFVFQC